MDVSSEHEPNATVNGEIPVGFVPIAFGRGFADHIGPIFVRQVPARDGSPVRGDLGFRVMAHHCNPAGICHGGMMMAVMDMAIGMAIAIASGTTSFVPSVNLAYDFMRPGVLGHWLESRIEYVHTTRRTGFANAYLVGPDGPVMRANGICKITTTRDPLFGRFKGPTSAQAG